MSRVVAGGVGCFVVGLAALALAAVIGGAGAPVMRALLAGWLVIVAAPLGALPILMALDLAGRSETPGSDALRLVLAGLPFAALLGALPLVLLVFMPRAFDLSALYPWAGATHETGALGAAARWFALPWFEVRTLLTLVVFVVLGFVFMKPADGLSRFRLPIAALGLGLVLCLGTLAALDWTMALDPGLNSPAFGLVLLTLQAAFAVTVALLITLARGPVARDLVLILLVCTAAAAFMQFTQYLVVWSANLPREIVWYQHRRAGLGTALFAVAPVVLAIVFSLLMPAAFLKPWALEKPSALRGPPALGPPRRHVAMAASLLLVFEIANLLWLVTPSWRGAFSVSLLDGLALVGLGGVIGAGALLVHPRRREARHG